MRRRRRYTGRRAQAIAILVVACFPACAAAAGGEAFVVVGDRVPKPLTATPGDAVSGRRIVLDRSTGNCLICHQAPEPAERFQGDIAPSLAGVGSRLDPGQIRLRVIDQGRINAATVMPPYYRTTGLNRVAARFQGKPALSAQEIEDVVAYLATLKE